MLLLNHLFIRDYLNFKIREQRSRSNFSPFQMLSTQYQMITFLLESLCWYGGSLKSISKWSKVLFNLCLIVTKLGTMVATWDSGYLVKGQGQTPGLCSKCFLLNTLWNTNLCPINAFAFLLNIILGCLSYKTKP